MRKLMLALLVTLFASIAHAQGDPNNAPAGAEKRTTVPGTKLTIAFPEGWSVEEKDGKTIAASPDDAVHIFAAVFPKVEDIEGESEADYNARVKAKRDELIADYLVDFELAPQVKGQQNKAGFRKIDGLGGAISNEGTAKSKATDQPVQWRGDNVFVEGGIEVLVLAYGSEQALADHAAAIKQIRNSYKKAD